MLPRLFPIHQNEPWFLVRNDIPERAVVPVQPARLPARWTRCGNAESRERDVHGTATGRAFFDNHAGTPGERISVSWDC